MPAAAFVFGGQGDAVARVYVYSESLTVCVRDGQGVITTGRYPEAVWSLWPRAGVPYIRIRVGAASDAELLIGAVPAGATTVLARTGSAEVAGTVHDGLFAVWGPDGGLDAAEVRASRDGTVVAAGPATALVGALDEVALAQACRG